MINRMERWQKKEVLAALNEKTNVYSIIKFCDVARELGYKHIKTDDVAIIASWFLKANPTYSSIRYVKDISHITSSESLFTTLAFMEYENPDINYE